MPAAALAPNPAPRCSHQAPAAGRRTEPLGPPHPASSHARGREGEGRPVPVPAAPRPSPGRFRPPEGYG